MFFAKSTSFHETFFNKVSKLFHIECWIWWCQSLCERNTTTFTCMVDFNHSRPSVPPSYWLNLITRTRARLSLLPINFIINAQISTQQSICSAKAKERWVCRWRWATYLSDYWPQIWCLPPLSMLSFHYTFIASRPSPRDVSPWCAKTPSMLFPSTHGSEVRCAPHSKIAIFILLSYFSHPNNNVYLKHNPRSLSHSQPQHNEQKVNPPGVKNRKISLPQQEQAESISE